MTGDALKMLQELSETVAEAVARQLGDGREATVVLGLYNARLVVGPAGRQFYDDVW